MVASGMLLNHAGALRVRPLSLTRRAPIHSGWLLITKQFGFISNMSPKKCVFGCHGKLANHGSLGVVCVSVPATKRMY